MLYNGVHYSKISENMKNSVNFFLIKMSAKISQLPRPRPKVRFSQFNHSFHELLAPPDKDEI